MSALRPRVERLVEAGLGASAGLSIAATALLVVTMALEVTRFFAEVTPAQVLFDTVWAPLFAAPRYGIWPLLLGTVVTTLLAVAVAVPLGLLSAVFLAELASPRTRRWLKPTLEVLAGVPTIAYGFFALTIVTPALQRVLPDLPGLNTLSPGLVMGVMITPLFGSIAEDALVAVPNALREASLALGANRLRTLALVVLPAARPGLRAALALAASRAMGETMIVAIAAGPSATMTAYIAQVGLGDVPAETTAFRTLFVVGAVLFALTLTLNQLARRGR